MTFPEKFVDRVQTLILTLVSKKIFIGSFWAWVATFLLIHKFITPEIWSMVILALLGMVFGIQSWEKKQGITYETQAQRNGKHPPIGD